MSASYSRSVMIVGRSVSNPRIAIDDEVNNWDFQNLFDPLGLKPVLALVNNISLLTGAHESLFLFSQIVI